MEVEQQRDLIHCMSQVHNVTKANAMAIKDVVESMAGLRHTISYLSTELSVCTLTLKSLRLVLDDALKPTVEFEEDEDEA